MPDSNPLQDFLTMLRLIRPEPNPAARIAMFVKLYRTAEDTLNFTTLSEPEYDELFSALSAACGFDDPLDALDALAHARNIRPSAA